MTLEYYPETIFGMQSMEELKDEFEVDVIETTTKDNIDINDAIMAQKVEETPTDTPQPTPAPVKQSKPKKPKASEILSWLNNRERVEGQQVYKNYKSIPLDTRKYAIKCMEEGKTPNASEEPNHIPLSETLELNRIEQGIQEDSIQTNSLPLDPPPIDIENGITEEINDAN